MRPKNPIEKKLARHVIRLAHDHPEWRGELAGALRSIQAADDLEKHTDLRSRLADMMSFGGSFGVLGSSGGKNDAEDKVRLALLKKELAGLGYRKFTPTKHGPAKDSLVVQNIRPVDLINLGKRYNQEHVIFRTKDGVIAVYSLTGSPTALVGVNPIGDSAFEIATDPSLRNRSKLMLFENGFLWAHDYPWDGSHMINRKHLRNHVQNSVFHVDS
jgi:hypothetical protein